MTKEGAAGYGFSVHHGYDCLGPAEVLSAEVTGALKGLQAALRVLHSPDQMFMICLANIAAARTFEGSSQDIFIEFQALDAAHGATHLRWVPGRAKIPGNEGADALAKTGCLKPVPAGSSPTLAYLRRAGK